MRNRSINYSKAVAKSHQRYTKKSIIKPVKESGAQSVIRQQLISPRLANV